MNETIKRHECLICEKPTKQPICDNCLNIYKKEKSHKVNWALFSMASCIGLLWVGIIMALITQNAYWTLLMIGTPVAMILSLGDST